MRILKLKLDNETYEALAKAAELEHRPIEMQAEFIIRRSTNSDERKTLASAAPGHGNGRQKGSVDES